MGVHCNLHCVLVAVVVYILCWCVCAHRFASSLHSCIHAWVWVCGCTMDCIKFTSLYSCTGMGMWMHHGVGDGYVDAPWSGWWCILALVSLLPPPPPVSTAQSTHTRAPNTLSVCPPLSEATSCEWCSVEQCGCHSKVLLVRKFWVHTICKISHIANKAIYHSLTRSFMSHTKST